MTAADRRQLADIQAVTPAQLTAYLAGHGWHHQGLAPSGTASWQYTAPAGHLIATALVPDRMDDDGYAARIWDVLHVIARVEQRPGLEGAVLADVLQQAPARTLSAQAEIIALLQEAQTWMAQQHAAPTPDCSIGPLALCCAQHNIRDALRNMGVEAEGAVIEIDAVLADVLAGAEPEEAAP